MEAEPQGNGSRRQARRRAISVTTRFLVTLNLTVVIVLGSFLAWDYTLEWESVVASSRMALDEEALVMAELLVPHVGDPESIQAYMDRICERVEETQSPGHHIAVRTPDHVLQSSAHHPPSPEMYDAMLLAAGSPGGTAMAPFGEIVVGRGTAAGAVVYVSKYLSTVREAARAHLARRVGAVVAFAALLGLLVSWLAHRLVTRPLLGVVEAVQRLRAGELGVRAKAGRSAEFAFLAGEFNRMSEALRDAEEQRRQAMQRARSIQRHILPRVDRLRGVKARAIYEPADEVAGDYYDVFEPGDGSVLICIADVSGHGVPAAMSAAMLKALTQTRAEQESHLGLLLARINQAYSDVSLADEFATMFLALFSPSAMTLHYAGAGHETGYLIRRSGETVTLGATGLPLGVMPEGLEWKTLEAPVQEGDRLVLLTDGIVEARNAAGEAFGRERLRSLLDAGREDDLDQLSENVRAAVEGHCTGMPRGDDITLLFVQLLDTRWNTSPFDAVPHARRESP